MFHVEHFERSERLPMCTTDMYAEMLDKLERLIYTANETIEKACKVNAYWLIDAAEKELIFAKREKEKYLKKLIERNGIN